MDAEQRLKERLREDLLWVYTESLRVFGRAHKRYLQMLGADADSAVAGAKRLIRRANDTNDFYLDRLDLSAEAVVLKPEYRQLFDAEDIDIAEKKMIWLKLQSS